ncbi:hypothetical protein J2T02_004738 [Chitinophaga terrae (ex Kim and Jung 2007)]|uniref:hypothetical protein n=1 Tax=Chitinophaga terrae (ex Kim and Jung 2007) TaxID=408074 RepID=UPI0027870FD2|nr:hypothetical protein [Chitinophaga terrae (ex Kim and Jung 2007)]MDQ0109594.1 hypothetical protein [Chitinophaga terrae (ex Kim and Jung 2007)]
MVAVPASKLTEAGSIFTCGFHAEGLRRQRGVIFFKKHEIEAEMIFRDVRIEAEMFFLIEVEMFFRDLRIEAEMMLIKPLVFNYPRVAG